MYEALHAYESGGMKYDGSSGNVPAAARFSSAKPTGMLLMTF